MARTSWVRPVVSIQYRLVTDGHTTYRASIASRGNSTYGIIEPTTKHINILLTNGKMTN